MGLEVSFPNTVPCPHPHPGSLVLGLQELRAATPLPTLRKNEGKIRAGKSQAGPGLVIPLHSGGHRHTRPPSAPAEVEREGDFPQLSLPPPPTAGSLSLPRRPLQPAQNLNELCCLMSPQLLSASLFPASLAWFGGFCVCFLRFSPTVPHPEAVIWALPPPRAVPSLEEGGGWGCSDQGIIFPKLGCSPGSDGMRVGNGPF